MRVKRLTRCALLTAIALLPFTNQLVKLSMAIVRDDKPEQQRHPEMHTLDDKLYISPAVAVAEATKAVAGMGGVGGENFVRGVSLRGDSLVGAE